MSRPLPKWIAISGSGAALGIAIVGLLQTTTEPSWLMALSVGMIVLRIAWQDIVDFTIPDGAVLALAAAGAAFRVAGGAAVAEPLGETALAAAIDLAISGGLLLAVREAYFRRRGYDGLGFGDVKLAAAGGVLAGTSGFAWALLAASLAGILATVTRGGGRRFRLASTSPDDKLPFGAILAPALWLAWLMGLGPPFPASMP